VAAGHEEDEEDQASSRGTPTRIFRRPTRELPLTRAGR
jgi:hypothetical protein